MSLQSRSAAPLETKKDRPLLLGHRGARLGRSPRENTPPAFDLALHSGCDGFEFDLRLAGDHQAVICHDAKSGKIEIAACSAANSGLPLLRDVLERYHETAFLNIELKVVGLETITLDLLRAFPPTRGFVVSSFLPQVIKATHSFDASVPLGLICESTRQFGRWPDLPVEYIIPHQNLLTAKLIDEVKAAGKKIFVWTVNSPARMRRFAQMGVDGIISDDPALLARTLRRTCRDNL